MTTLDHVPQSQIYTSAQSRQMTQSASVPTVNTRALFSMTVVFLIAAAFRIYHITQQSIWFDEAFAWNIIVQNDMFPRITADTHPPLYYVLLRVWVGAAGESPLALRYLSALISMGTVAFVYGVAREIIGSHNREKFFYIPVFVALILALSDAEIFLAQETRNYSLYTFFGTLSMWMYLRWLRQPTRWKAILWAGSTAALMYTHYQGVFIPAVQGMHVLLFLRGNKRLYGVATLVLSGLIFLPWFIGVTVPQAQNAIDNALPFAIPSNWETFVGLLNSYLGAQWALMLVLMIVGVGNIRQFSWGMVFVVVMWFALPFGVLFFGNYFASLLTERKLLIIAPALALMIGFGLGRFGPLGQGVMVLAIVIYGASAVDYYREKEPWEDIAGRIAPYVQADDIAMMEIGVGQYPLKYYWQRTLPEDTLIMGFPFLGDFTMAPTTDWFTYYNAYLPELLQENVQNSTDAIATVWFVFWSQERTALDRLQEAGYTRTMTLTHDLGANIIETYRYDVLPDAPMTTFENGMTLQAVSIDADDLRVDLWWSAGTSLAADFTTSVLLLDQNDAVVAQLDSPPALATRPTTTWQPGEVVFDPKTLQLAEGITELPTGIYRAVAQVYQWTPEGIINFNTADGSNWVEIGVLEIE